MAEPETRPSGGTPPARPRIAVVGTGWWATQYHLPGLVSYDGAEVVALVDPDADRLDAATATFGVPAAFVDVDELLASVPLDGLVVATTSTAHYAVARKALEAGVNVMVEKPMTVSSAEAWELVRVAREQGLHLQVGYTYNHTRSAVRLHEVVAGGGIGEVLHVSGLFSSMVEAFYRGHPEEYAGVYKFPVTGPSSRTYSDPAVAGGGQGHTQVTHLLGMILWVTGGRASEVSAFMDNRGLAVDLVDAIAYRTQEGTLGTLGSTGNLRPGDPTQQEIRYYGTDGFALQDLVSATVEIRYADGRVEHVAPRPDEEPYPALATARGLADLIAGRGPDLAPGEVGARVVELLEASYLSAARGERVHIDELGTGNTDEGNGLHRATRAADARGRRAGSR